MENLAIEATKQTPKVSFDAENHVLEFQGEYYPENMALFANLVEAIVLSIILLTILA